MTKLLIQWLLTQAKSAYHFLGRITVAIILGIPILVLFGDTFLLLLGHALTILGHGLHLVFELIESFIGHVLEAMFHLSKRTAEIIFFWVSLSFAIGLSWYLSHKARILARQAVMTAKEKRRAMAESSRIKLWIRLSLIISSLSATLYLFT